MVRVGIGLYGIGFDAEEQKKLIPVGTLKATISQIKHLEKGDSVGYGRAYTADHPHDIAVVSIGYADGLSRVLGNGRGKMLANGKMASIIGNICMDMCMINIEGIDVKEGDTVEIFGKELPIQNVAEAMNTIAYEVLTNVSQRVSRVYYQ
jgi:alanine racemase